MGLAYQKSGARGKGCCKIALSPTLKTSHAPLFAAGVGRFSFFVPADRFSGARVVPGTPLLILRNLAHFGQRGTIDRERHTVDRDRGSSKHAIDQGTAFHHDA